MLEESAPGSARRNLKKDTDAVDNWLDNAPGLNDKIQFLAWKHRSESPVIMVKTRSTSLSDSGPAPEVVMIPRAKWDDITSADPDVLAMPSVRQVRLTFTRSDFHADKELVLCVHVSSSSSGVPYNEMIGIAFLPKMSHILSSAYMTLTADEYAAEVGRCQNDPYAVYVRLVGLQGAAHLNGREGVLHGRDPNSSERFRVGLAGGKKVSVRSQNYERIQRPRLFDGIYMKQGEKWVIRL